MSSSRRLLILPAALAIVLAAPAAATHVTWGDPALPDRIDCGLADDVPLDALRGPAGAEDGTDEPAAALRRLLSGEKPIVGGGPFPKRGYRELDRSPDRVVYGAGHGRRIFHVAVDRLPDGAWDVGVVGSCLPEPSHPGGDAAGWRLRPGAPPPRPATRSLRIAVRESACANGRRATGRVLPPRVFVDGQRVVVSVFVRPVRGPARCPGNPSTPYVVRLPVALGSRVLFDGSTVPAHAERRRP